MSTVHVCLIPSALKTICRHLCLLLLPEVCLIVHYQSLNGYERSEEGRKLLSLKLFKRHSRDLSQNSKFHTNLLTRFSPVFPDLLSSASPRLPISPLGLWHPNFPSPAERSGKTPGPFSEDRKLQKTGAACEPPAPSPRLPRGQLYEPPGGKSCGLYLLS